MKIMFYDIALINLKKYIGDVVCRIIEDESIDVILLYDEFSEEGYNFYKNKRCRMIKNRCFFYSQVKGFLVSEKPNLFMVNAQRLSDSAFLSVAKKLEIKTGMIQHGMYIPFLKRERFFFIKKMIKTLKYFLYSQIIAKSMDKNGINVFRKYYSTFIKGKIYKDAIDFTDKVNTDFVLVYGEYWKDYHHDIFGYSKDVQKIIGYHELNRLKEIKEQEFETESVCYIAQTLVEDGRLSRQQMRDFLLHFADVCKNRRVYVKLHPRSDKSLFDELGFILNKNKIPNCGLYVGHYSSLLAIVGHLEGRLVLFEFAGHEIPFYFKSIGALCNDYESFASAVSKMDSAPSSESISYFFSEGYDTGKTVSFLMSKL